MKAKFLMVCGLALLICGCAGNGPKVSLAEAQAQHDAMSKVCYESAGEVISRQAPNVSALYFSPRSSVMGAWEFELFYGVGEPRKWGTIDVQSDRSPSREDRVPGAYQVRYTHVPVHRTIGKTVLTFNGVLQEVVDLSSNEVIASRRNYIWGTDFNRSSFCLGANWYDGNYGFLERVLGPRYVERPRSPPPERYIKAVIRSVSEVDQTLPSLSTERVLPPGAKYDYNNRTVTLPDGKFGMPSYWNSGPIEYAGTLVSPDYYVFVMLPEGRAQNWPLRKVLLSFRNKQGAALKNVYVQLPLGVDWSGGWGILPGEISIEGDKIEFALYGMKVRGKEYYDRQNPGRYRRKYIVSASMD
ncbi:hypothetical protein PV762_01220 [Mitsuaria sp. CC2]|uniref:hypothetical protein n=1 Tax=Mitsuaria sp. CC2 TaxID=3029186 RepID=UPI003B8E4F1E